MKLKEDGFEVKVPLIYRLLQPAHTVSRISNARRSQGVTVKAGSGRLQKQKVPPSVSSGQGNKDDPLLEGSIESVQTRRCIDPVPFHVRFSRDKTEIFPSEGIAFVLLLAIHGIISSQVHLLRETLGKPDRDF